MNAPVCKHQFHRNLLGRCSTCSSLGSQQNSMASSSSQQSSIKHIHELPYPVRTALCELLDSDNSWKRLGGEFLHFSDTKLKLFSFAILRNSSPTNAMFEALDRESFTISRLFRYLLAMSHKRAMQILLPYVDDKLKALYDAEDENNSMQFVDKNSSKLAHATNGYNNGHYHGPPNPHIIRIRPASPDVGNSSDYGAAGGGCNNSWNNLNFKKRTHVNRNGEYSDQSNDSRVTSENDREIASLERDLEVPYCELLAATDNFSESRRIGKGGFGVVYRGTWKGTEVAIKKLKGCDNIGQARNELRALNRYRIDNILPIYGISTDGPEACLLYQFMPNGSLEDRLLCKKGTPPLTWEQRADIGEGLAKALNLLHSLRGEPLVHGDVKSANVLLDSQFQCKLGDFGLAKQMIVSQRFGAATHLTVESVHGTCVYLPSEYLRSKRLSPKVDVYSYGIVMLEMATGKQAYDGKKHLLDLLKEELNAGQTDESRRGAIRLMDPKLQLKPEGSSWFKDLITLGIDCVNKDKRKRPDMAEVLKFFERCKTRDRIRRLSAEFREEPTAVVQSQQTPYLSVPYSNNFHCRIGGSTTSEIPPSAPSTVPQPSEAVQKTHLSSDPQETQSSILSDETQSNDSTKNNDSVPTQEGAVEATIPLITELGIVSKSTDSEN